MNKVLLLFILGIFSCTSKDADQPIDRFPVITGKWYIGKDSVRITSDSIFQLSGFPIFVAKSDIAYTREDNRLNCTYRFIEENKTTLDIIESGPEYIVFLGASKDWVTRIKLTK